MGLLIIFFYKMDDNNIEDKEFFSSVYKLFQREHDGTISSDDLETIMKSQGVNVSDNDIKEFLQEADPDNKGRLEFYNVSSFLVKCKKQSDIEEDLINAFRVFDKDNSGVITNNDLNTILCELGDNKVKEEDLEE